MDEKSLSHTSWNCKYHIVLVPKYRRKTIYGKLRKDIGKILRMLCDYKHVEIIEAHAMPDHIHMLLSIPPKLAVADFMGYLKGKSTLMIFERHANMKYKYGRRVFWTKGYYVNTVGGNEAKIRKYIYDAKLLIVDDNAELLALLYEQLRGAGYGHIRTAQSCAAARACFAAEQPELMILDINLPDGDGFSLFRALRAKADVPALFLSARDADADRLFGLGLGADDYLTKPFLMQELLLRVQHILQRAYRAELSRTKPAPLQLGERCVDLNDAIVTLPEGKTLTLTATELALLRKLAENRGHIVTYDALCAAVWGADYYGYENSLGVHIRHLREKLEAEPGAPQFLRTVRGIGYKLTKGEEA